MTWQNLFTRVFIRHQLESEIESVLSLAVNRSIFKKKKKRKMHIHKNNNHQYSKEHRMGTGWKNSRVTNESSTRINKSTRVQLVSPGR